MSDILNAKIKQIELANKSNIFNLVWKFDLNNKLVTLATKTELKAEQDKIVKLKTYELSYFLGNFFTGLMVLKKVLFINQHVVRYS